MIKRQIIYHVSTSLVLLFCSCGTYTTFYSKTHIEIDSEKLSKVHRLDLSNQDLEELPVTIADLKDLRMINLSNNAKLDINGSLHKLAVHKNLEVLILDSLGIKTIPESIKLFPNLKQISLVHNPALNLEQAITQISGLPIEFLNLKNNKLTKLPENITTLKNLKDLNLSYNTIQDEESYSYLGKLPKLYSLWIDHNKLKKLPSTIGELSQIRFFYIDHNELKDLPAELGSMKKVWVIHAGYNQFAELPKVFTTQKSLLMVHINNNQIKAIPKDFETEKYPLAGLLLDNNPLPNTEIEKAKKLFSGFFLLSFEQRVYK
ncbi:leucine-rich repeat domain-containing protein [uncultured Aquimarina sp.]|uniref:leucine-rich repeat domain-containing protein n=1 Tax=uncultured Aquimarina sp. TaxID=575652 RepID=UPI0026315CB5|nr:leucine-rich repeat domain-containing protein [uncultured Aquimarina sp.]